MRLKSGQKSHQMKMLHECLGSFGTHNLMVTFVFKIFCEERSMPDQTRSNWFKFSGSIFYNKSILSSCPVLLQDSKNVICFHVRHLEIPKIALQKMTISSFLVCFYHSAAKNKDVALKCCMRVVCMHFYNKYAVFYDSNISDITVIFWKKITFSSFGLK